MVGSPHHPNSPSILVQDFDFFPGTSPTEFIASLTCDTGFRVNDVRLRRGWAGPLKTGMVWKIKCSGTVYARLDTEPAYRLHHKI